MNLKSSLQLLKTIPRNAWFYTPAGVESTFRLCIGRSPPIVTLLYATQLLTVIQVKRQCNGCGNGGDWALKLDAQQLSNTQTPVEDAQAVDESQPKSRRISVMFYIADEREQELLLDSDSWKDRAKSRLCSSGQHLIAGDWQLHVTSTSELQTDMHVPCVDPMTGIMTSWHD